MSSDSTSQEILTAMTDVNLEDVNLNNCDREPIHIPNLIQSHGVLLTIDPEDYTILQVSLNTSQILGIEPQELLNKPLNKLLREEQVSAISDCLSKDLDRLNPLKIELICGKIACLFDGVVHHNGNALVLELEPRETSDAVDFFDFYKLVKNPVGRIHQAHDIEELCNLIVREIRTITGFDRVMVYRFNSEGVGQVIAEAANSELESFLGLHYPDTDIPKQAKYLYTLNHLHLIPDTTYEPVGLTPQLNPLTDKFLNMSMSALRSVSPLHTEYLGNMGVAASMSVSLLKNKQLWGLIACHHQTPKTVSYEIRTVCEFIGQIVSLDLAAKEDSQDLDYKIKLKHIQSQFVARISQAEDLETALSENPLHLLDLVGAGGVALSFGGNITLVGNTPSKEEIQEMLPWLIAQFDEETIYETNNLAQQYISALAYPEVASGLLALLISRVGQNLIIWFRPEVVQTISWGGNPQKIVKTALDGTVKISPRKSFAKWQEMVKLKSLPWKACEVEAALELRSSIVGIVLRKADELAQINQELSRSNDELDAFAYIASHDLKEPLRGIYNYSSFLIEDYGEVLDESGKDKLNTLMRLTHRMEDLINSLLHYSRLGRAELQVHSLDLNDSLAEVLDVIRLSARDTRVEFEIPRSLPTIKCDRTQINELFTNLISNGIKYNQKAQKIVEIGYLDRGDTVFTEKMLDRTNNILSKTVFYVRDNGIGIRAKHLESIFRIFKRLHGQKKYGGGTGAGLTIAKKIVERHGGEIWVESIYQEGTTFYFTLE